MPVLRISDLSDPRLVDYSHQTDVALRKARGAEHGIYIAESAIVLARALGAGHRPRSVLALGSALDDALALVGERDVPVFTGPAELLAGLTGYVLHRGLIASMERPAPRAAAELVRDARTLVVIENVVDPTNVGAIFRSVAGIGADAVLVTERCSDPLYRRSIRVSMGTVLQVPWARIGPWPQARALFTERGFTVAALALTDDAVSLRQFAADRPERVAVVLGTEGDGLTPEAIDASDVIVRIPMSNGVDSLNVASASAVALYALLAP